MKAYTTRAGVKQYKPAANQLHRIVESDNDEGFCLACGEHQYGIEPDTRKGKCDACGAMKVYGAEELLLMGLFHN